MAIDNKDKKVLNVPHLRFPEFSGEWDSFKLVELGKFIGGGTPSSSNLSFWTGSIPWISSSDIKEDNINNISISRYITEDAIEKSATKYCPAPVILIVSRVGVGKVALSHTSLCTSQDFCNIIDIKCHPVFLSYNLLRTMKRKSREVQGTSIKGITSDELQKIRVFIPKNKDEQNKISNLLTLLDERIVTQNKIIEDLKKLKSAITDLLFHSIADAHTIRLGEIAHITNGAGDVQDANTEHQEDWYPFFDRSEELKWFPTYSFDKEAVIYAGEGQSFYPRYYNGKFALHQRCYAITDFASCIIPKYCYHFMNTLNSYFVRNSVGSTVPSLRMDIFQKVEIRLPPIPKQQHICKIIDAFYTKLEVEQRGISILQELKQFLLSQMFI